MKCRTCSLCKTCSKTSWICWDGFYPTNSDVLQKLEAESSCGKFTELLKLSQFNPVTFGFDVNNCLWFWTWTRVFFSQDKLIIANVLWYQRAQETRGAFLNYLWLRERYWCSIITNFPFFYASGAINQIWATHGLLGTNMCLFKDPAGAWQNGITIGEPLRQDQSQWHYLGASY